MRLVGITILLSVCALAVPADADGVGTDAG